MANVDRIEALREALANAKALATEYAIEMYGEAQRAQYSSERRSLQVSEDQQPFLEKVNRHPSDGSALWRNT